MKSVISAKGILDIGLSQDSYKLRQQRRQEQRQQLIDNNKNKHRIMIVNDDRPNRNLNLRHDLERNGLVVDIFTDPVRALNHFRAGLFDIVVLDRKMSKMNAIGLHKNFKRIDNKIRICVLSSSEIYLD